MRVREIVANLPRVGRIVRVYLRRTEGMLVFGCWGFASIGGREGLRV
jgi:hypothetical protein